MGAWLLPPNLLSLLRLLMVGPVYLHIAALDFRGAFFWFAAASVTDALDGWLARRFAWQSRLGMFLDPVADKALLDSTYLALARASVLPWWLAALVIGRDLFITALALAGLRLTAQRQFPPTLWGKLSTVMQVLTALTAIAGGRFSIPAISLLLPWIAAATAAATLWSGIHYGWLGYALWRGVGKRLTEPVA